MSLFSDLTAFAVSVFTDGPPWPFLAADEDGMPSDVVAVDPRQSARMALVYQCLALSSEIIGVFPPELYRRSGRKKEPLSASDLPIGDILLRAPSEYMDWGTFVELVPCHGRAWGSFVAEKQRNGDGQLVALHPIEPWRLSKVALGQNGDGAWVKRFWFRGHPEPFTEEDVFHVPFFGYSGIDGLGAFEWGRDDIRMSWDVRSHGRNFFRRGLHADMAVIKTHGGFTDGEKGRIDQAFAEHRGARNSHKTLKIAGPYQMKQLTIPLRESQWVEAAGVSDVDICRRFMVPPEFASVSTQGSSGTLVYKNLTDDQRRLFLLNHLSTVGRIERAVDRLIRQEAGEDDIVWRLVTEETLRFDPKLRYELASLSVDKWMTRNEARDRTDGLDPHPGTAADQLYVDGKMQPVGSSAGQARALGVVAPVIERAVQRMARRAAKNESRDDPGARAAAAADFAPLASGLAAVGVEMPVAELVDHLLAGAADASTEELESTAWASARVAQIMRRLEADDAT